MSLEKREPAAPERKDMKEGKEAANITDIRVIGNDGKLTEPIAAKIIGVGSSSFSGRPELKYQLVKGTMTTYTAEWKEYKGVEGRMAYPMD
jgi:hypothetical protein